MWHLLPVASRDSLQIAAASSGRTLLTRRTGKRRACMRWCILITLCPLLTCQVSYLSDSEAIYFHPAAVWGHRAGSRRPQHLACTPRFSLPSAVFPSGGRWVFVAVGRQRPQQGAHQVWMRDNLTSPVLQYTLPVTYMSKIYVIMRQIKHFQ